MKIDGSDQHCQLDDDGDYVVVEEEELALTLVNANDHLILPTKFGNWLSRKVIRPLLFTPASSSSSSSSELILFRDSSSSDSGLRSSKYDVFISFRGVDVRNSFHSHLYYHLNCLKKLAVYSDDADLERGRHISPDILLAIERSVVYIVILSPNYAGSPWCLEELKKILRCRKLYGRRAIPVFYGVHPSDVEKQKLPSTTTIAAAANVQSWRDALREIASLSGFDSQVIRRETELIEEVTKNVFQAIRSSSEMVKLSSYSVSRGLVGLEIKMKQVQRLLCFAEMSNRTIGLWGMAGIGKTALAKAIFDVFSCQFEASYFFSNFADASQLRRDLQSDFFSKLLGDESGGRSALSYELTLHRLGRMKVLVVIDDIGNDVGNIGPLKDLLNGQYCDLFGPGSKIIMTSRNKQLLKSVCHHVYEVEPLNDGEAFQLFCLHAFRSDNSPQSEYMEMALAAAHYASGNPLAITVLGAHLHGRDLQFWDRELKALHGNPDPVVENILRRSYVGLSRVEKDVFLDIACFYNYWYRMELKECVEMLSPGGTGNIIPNLVDKALISIDMSFADTIVMNALLKDFGRRIVNEERHIEKRSRLWNAKDEYYLFKKKKGTASIEGISWVFGGDEGYMPPETKTYIQSDAFVKMENLRFLVVHLGFCNLIPPDDGLISLPNTLKVLEWHSFSSKSLPSQFSAEHLVILNLKYSKIEQVWEGDELMDLGNLKYLYLCLCRNLRKLPNLSTARRLERIELFGCESLAELPKSIWDLPKLEWLDVTGCRSLQLNYLECPEQNTGLDSVYSSSTSCSSPILELGFVDYMELAAVPSSSSMGDLTPLTQLNFSGCTSLESLPNTIHKLSNLQTLNLRHCHQLIRLPGLPSSLTDLDASDCTSLQTLSIDNILENHDLSKISRWDFSQCWKLDPVVCSKLVDKFTQDWIRNSGFPCIRPSRLRLPGKWDIKSAGEGGSIMGCNTNNDDNNNAMATAQLRGQPWKLKALILCALLDYRPLADYLECQVDCVLLNNGVEVAVSSCNLTCCPSYEDHEDEEEHLPNGHIWVWFTNDLDKMRMIQQFADKEADHPGGTVEFLFRSLYWPGKIPELTKNCRVIPIYDDRVLTYEDEEEEDNDRSPHNVIGLYDKLRTGQCKYFKATSKRTQWRTAPPSPSSGSSQQTPPSAISHHTDGYQIHPVPTPLPSP
ncbi:unnamed protein product [Linum trigynum]|uniref:TIR domain-containing protein n=1 Tax=Linum trigynum TaxID=586398 RepID=A0AAV2CAG3_9ROSI